MPRRKAKKRSVSKASQKQNRQTHKARQTIRKSKLVLAIIVLAAFAVSAFNITGFVVNSRTIAFVTLSDKLQGSEQTLYSQMSASGAVTVAPLSEIPEDLSGYKLIAISKLAGDTFTDEQRSLCKKILEFNKPIIFFSGQFSTVCRLTAGSSISPPMPWEVINKVQTDATGVNSPFYPTEQYSGTVIPYQSTGNLPAVVESGSMIRLIKRSSNDAYLAIFLSSPRKAFFSVPDSAFAFTPVGSDMLERTLRWLESA